LALLICFCTGLSLGVRRAVRRQIDSLVVPVRSASPTRQFSEKVGNERVSPVEPLAVSQADSGRLPPSAPHRPSGTPLPGMTLQPMVSPEQVELTRNPDAPRVSEETQQDIRFQSALLVGQASVQEGDEVGAIADKEDVLVVSLDDPSLGAYAPPPQLGSARSVFAPAPATSMEEMVELTDADVNADEHGTSRKRDKKAKAGSNDVDDHADDDDDGGKRKKGKKDGKHEKGKTRKVSDADVDGEGDDGEKKKKKKKKKKDDDL